MIYSEIARAQKWLTAESECAMIGATLIQSMALLNCITGHEAWTSCEEGDSYAVSTM